MVTQSHPDDQTTPCHEPVAHATARERAAMFQNELRKKHPEARVRHSWSTSKHAGFYNFEVECCGATTEVIFGDVDMALQTDAERVDTFMRKLSQDSPTCRSVP